MDLQNDKETAVHLEKHRLRGFVERSIADATGIMWDHSIAERTGADLRNVLERFFGSGLHSPHTGGRIWRAARRLLGLSRARGPVPSNQLVMLPVWNDHLFRRALQRELLRC